MSKKSLIVYIVAWSLVGDSLRRRHNLTSVSNVCEPREGGGGGALPYKRLMGMCRLMGSHFHDLIDYKGDAFSIELLGWGRTFPDFLW